MLFLQMGQKWLVKAKLLTTKGMIGHVYVTNTYNDEKPKASRQVVQSIMDSDLVVLGPGSIYVHPAKYHDSRYWKSSVRREAQVVYICNHDPAW